MCVSTLTWLHRVNTVLPIREPMTNDQCLNQLSPIFIFVYVWPTDMAGDKLVLWSSVCEILKQDITIVQEISNPFTPMWNAGSCHLGRGPSPRLVSVSVRSTLRTKKDHMKQERKWRILNCTIKLQI